MTKPLLLIGLLIPTLFACSEGYSEEEQSLNLHLQMSQTEALAALNTIGARPHLEPQRAYQLHQNCELEVITRDSMLRPSKQRVHLALTDASLIKEDGGDVFSLLLRPKGIETPLLTPVLTEGTWRDASQAKWVLNYLLKFCLAGTGTSTPPTQPLAGGGYFKLQLHP